MCKPKSSGISLQGLLVAAAIIVCLPVLGWLASTLGSLLEAVAVAVGVACVVSGAATVRLIRYGSLRRPARDKRVVNPVMVRASRELPAPPRAIEAPRVIVVTPADVLATPTPRPRARRTAGWG